MKSKKTIWYYVRNYKFNSIFIKNFLLIFMLVSLPLCIIGFSVKSNVEQLLEEEVSTINQHSLYRVKDVIDNVLKDCEKMATQMTLRNEIEMYFISSKDKMIVNNTYYKIFDSIKVLTLVHNYIESVYIYSEKNGLIYYKKNDSHLAKFGDDNWYNNYNKLTDNKPYIQIRKFDDYYPYFISIIKPTFFDKDQKLGAIIFNINVEELCKIINHSMEDLPENIFIIDDQGKIIYNNDMNLFMKNIRDIEEYKNIPWSKDDYSKIVSINNEKFIISSSNSFWGNWRYISLVPMMHYNQKIETINNLLFKLLLLNVLIAVVVSFLISLGTFEPVKNIMSILEDPKKLLNKTNKKYIEEQEMKNELKYIASNITKIIYSNRYLEDEMGKRIELLNKAQTTALQAQMNPHFLYNTLETVNWLAISVSKGPNQISDIVTSLSKLLRFSLDSENQLDNIEDEINYCKLYIDIMKVRYKDKFEVVWDIDQSIMEYKIVKLSFQPIIENTIYHGIKPTREKGIIIIKGDLKGDMITISFEDNGIGIDEKRLEQLSNNLNKEYVFSKENIGIRNVNQRIKLIFGENYGIEVKSKINKGTCVMIRIPKML